jgi:hypothetical protein
MRNVTQKPQATKGRVAMILILYILSILIILLGAGFSVYSVINNVQLKVMSSTMPGMVFGMVILFLGIRYTMSLSKLKEEVYKSTGFSWSNFRKARDSKA